METLCEHLSIEVFRFILDLRSRSRKMAEAVVLKVEPRTAQGTRVARRLRKTGLVPAVLYGHKQETVSLAVSGDELGKAIRHGARVVDLHQEGNVEKVLIRDLQWDPLGMEIYHVDFSRVSADERVVLEVKVLIRGTAPGVTAGGVLDQPLHTLEIECSVIAVPESIRVNIGELQLGSAIHVRDLTLAEGLVVKNDPDAIVIQVVQKEEETEEGVAGEMAEPEVIGRKPGEDEEEAE